MEPAEKMGGKGSIGVKIKKGKNRKENEGKNQGEKIEWVNKPRGKD